MLDNFDDRYLGSKTSDPSVDNDGNALLIGALYFNTTDGVMKVYTASGWIAASSASVATLATYEFVATSGQTVFTGADANGATLSYVAPALLVTLNGVRLRPGDDYTATNGTSITLVSAAALNDELVVDAFGTFLVASVDGANIQNGTTNISKLNATGTRSSSTFLAGDNSFKTVSVTPTAVSDQANSSTGYFDIPSGTTAQRPGSPATGMIRLNTTTGMNEIYDGTGWMPQGVLVKMEHWRDNTRRVFSAVSTQNYEAVTGTITRRRADTGILVTGQWYGGGGTVNYPSIGMFFKLNTNRHSRGITYTGRDSSAMNSHSMVGFNIYFTPAELGSTTGTINWAWGWNWPNSASEALRPMVGMNANASDDGRVSGAQEGSALTFWEFLPGIDSYGG